MELKKEILVAVVDDNLDYHQEIKDKLNTIFESEALKNLDFNFAIDFYEGGLDLINSSKEYGLVFMDYEMPDMNGIETALELEKKGATARILFLSGYKQLISPLQQGYGIKLTAGFLFKTDPLERFIFEVEKVVADILDFHVIEFKYYTTEFESDTGKERRVFRKKWIDRRKIVMIKAKGKSTAVVTEEAEYWTLRSLKKWKGVLPASDFSLANRSRLVNFKYVHFVRNQKVELIYQKEMIKLSRSVKDRFEHDHYDYIQRKALR